MAEEKSGLAGFIDRVKHTRIARGLLRYGTANGNLLAGGIAFSAMFSVVAAITLAFTAFTIVLGGNEELRDRVIDAIAEALPGLIQTGGEPDSGILAPDQLTFSGTTGIAGVIAVIVLLVSAIRVPAGLRLAVRSMFGMVAPPENPVFGKLRDLLGFLGLALSVLLTSALGIAAGAAGEWLLSLIGWNGTTVGTWILRLVGLLVVLMVDVLVFVWLYRALAGVRPPTKDLWLGALIGGIGAGAIRYLGTSLVSGSLGTSPVAGAAAAVATLLLWINLIVRVTLIVAAWVANPPAPPEVEDDMVTHFDESPNYVTMSKPATLQWEHDPVTGRVQPEDAPEPEPEPKPEPYWGGLIGWIGRKVRALRRA